jgi:hypothetical protein
MTTATSVDPSEHAPRRRWYRLSTTHASPLRRIAVLLAITWMPMCGFAIAQNVALGPTPRGSFLLDFATYARFFVALPMLVIAEQIISPQLQTAARRFVDDGFVRAADVRSFESAMARFDRRHTSALAAIIIAGLAAIGAWRLTVERVIGVTADSWQLVRLPDGHQLHYSLAAVWNNSIAVPVVLFLTYRWIWRILIWTLFLADVARLELQLTPAHADRAGGLGFLEVAQTSFAVLAFAVGSIISAEVAFRIVFEGARITELQRPLTVLLVLMLVVSFGPPMVFSPALTRSRRAGVVTYGSLVVRYNRDFHAKWVEDPPEGPAPEGESERLLGSSDIQSLADIGNSYSFVRAMGFTPFSRRAVLVVALATVLPALPLLLLVVPIKDVLGALAKLAL